MTSAPPRPGSPRARVAIAVGLLAGVHLGLAVAQIPNHSPAADELLHIAAGYQLLRGDGGAQMDPTHPPLPRYLLSAPLAVLRPTQLEPAGRQGNDALADFLLKSSVSPGAILGSTRVMAALVSLALVLVAGAWARRLWGERAGLLTLLALAPSPLLLADAPIVGNDVACALTVLLAVAAFGRYLRAPTRGNLAWFGLAFFAAQTSKFSAVLLGPILLALYAAKRGLERRGQSPATAPRGRAAFWDATLVAVGAGLLLFALYQFQLQNAATDPWIARRPEAAQIKAALARLPAWLVETPIPAYDFWKGLAIQSFHAGNQDRWTGGNNHQFLLGMNSLDGWWYYFPVAIAVKTPLAFLALAGWAGVAAWQRRRAPRTRDGFELALLLVPPVLWLGCCMLLTINIGVRYVLPVYPFVAIAIGGLATVVRGRAAILVGVLCAWQGLSLARAMPHAHAHFNELVGGPAGGWRALNNSSIDWGQDLPALATYLREHQIEEPYFDYFGPFDPRDWGIRYRRLPDRPEEQAAVKGIVIVSQSHLTAENRREPLYTRLRGMRPIAQLGFTLFVYRL